MRACVPIPLGMTRFRVRSDERGFTIIEVMVAAVILVIGVLGTLALIDGANAHTDKNKRREAATNTARQVIEAVQRVGWDGMTNTAIGPALQALPGLSDVDSGTAGWQLENRGLRFQVVTSACSIDEPSDTRGVHSPSITWCLGEIAGSTDTSPEDLRQAQVTVTPIGTTASQPVVQTMVASKKAFTSFASTTTSGTTATTTTTTTTTGGTTGGTSGPSVGTLDSLGCSSVAGGPFSFNTSATSTSGCYQTAWTQSKYLSYGNASCASNCVTSIAGIGAVRFRLTTTATAPSVKWLLDGVVKGNATNTSGNTWEFTWDLADTYPNQTPDGGYEISAQVHDSGGTPTGTALRLPIMLNRFYPDGGAWSAPVGTWNPRWSQATPAVLNPTLASGPGTMEFEWYPSGSTAARMDRDLAGFQPMRCQGNSGCANPGSVIATCDPGSATGGINQPPQGLLTSLTFCRDTGAVGTNNIINFAARPIDRLWNGTLNAARLAASPATGDVVTSPANGAPSPPTNFTASSAGGDVTLSWSLPNTYAGCSTNCGYADPQATTDCVDFFRIYRGPIGQTNPAFTDRYDRTPYGVPFGSCGSASSASLVDSTPCDPPGCKYWITSVDRKLSESVVVGPVTG